MERTRYFTPPAFYVGRGCGKSTTHLLMCFEYLRIWDMFKYLDKYRGVAIPKVDLTGVVKEYFTDLSEKTGMDVRLNPHSRYVIDGLDENMINFLCKPMQEVCHMDNYQQQAAKGKKWCYDCIHYYTSQFCGYNASNCEVYGSLDVDQTVRHPNHTADICPDYYEDISRPPWWSKNAGGRCVTTNEHR